MEIDIDGVIHPVSAEFVDAGMKLAEEKNASLILIQLSTPGGLDTSMREIIEQMLETSGLAEFYRTDKDGAERLENLDELINAAEAFVTQEGFGKDAVALPVDEHSPGAIAEGLPAAIAPAAPATPDAETGEIMSPLAAFLTHASLEAGDNQAQAGQEGARQGEAEQGDERLRRGLGQAEDAEDDRGDHPDPRRQPVQAVDEVDRVDRDHDEQDGERHAQASATSGPHWSASTALALVICAGVRNFTCDSSSSEGRFFFMSAVTLPAFTSASIRAGTAPPSR